MVDSVSAITSSPAAVNQAAFNRALVEFTQTQSLIAASDAANNQDTDGFLAAQFPAGLESSAGTAQSNTRAEIIEGLFNVDSDTLRLLNEFGTTPRSAGITGNLTAQQLQEIGVLQADAERLAMAAFLTSQQPISSTATTINLSLIGRAIAEGEDANAVNQPLTQQQLAQIAQIIAPYLSRPLTPELLLQIQQQMASNQLNPMNLNLGILILVQNYLAGLQPYPYRTTQTHTADNENEEVVAPVGAIDRVAVEDSAIVA